MGKLNACPLLVICKQMRASSAFNANPFLTNEFDTVKSGLSIVYIEGSHVIVSNKSLKIDFGLENSADPDEMPH